MDQSSFLEDSFLALPPLRRADTSANIQDLGTMSLVDTLGNQILDQESGIMFSLRNLITEHLFSSVPF